VADFLTVFFSNDFFLGLVFLINILKIKREIQQKSTWRFSPRESSLQAQRTISTSPVRHRPSLAQASQILRLVNAWKCCWGMKKWGNYPCFYFDFFYLQINPQDTSPKAWRERRNWLIHSNCIHMASNQNESWGFPSPKTLAMGFLAWFFVFSLAKEKVAPRILISARNYISSSIFRIEINTGFVS